VQKSNLNLSGRAWLGLAAAAVAAAAAAPTRPCRSCLANTCNNVNYVKGEGRVARPRLAIMKALFQSLAWIM